MFLIFLAMIICVPLVLIFLSASWTAAEVAYVLMLLVHHPVHLSWVLGLLINLFSGGLATLFDIIVFVLRGAGAI